MTTDAAIVSLFEQTGFSAKEARVYAALLSLGEADATHVAKVSGVKRTNVYPLLEHLKERGYVSEVGGKKIRAFVPSDPTKVFRQLENSTKMFREMLPFLQAYVQRSGALPRIQYFEGKEAVTSVYHDIHHYKDVCFINSIAHHAEIFPDEVRYWEKVFAGDNFRITARSLHTDTPADRAFVAQVSKKKFQARFFPKGIDFVMDFSIYGDMIGISSVTKEPFIVVIQSKDLADSMRTIFNLLWASADPKKQKVIPTEH